MKGKFNLSDHFLIQAHSLEKYKLLEVLLMITAKARAVDGPDKPFRAAEINRRDLDSNDVLIEIKYAGICHSDIHTAHGEWGPVNYPLVPGHEIAGIVTDVGTEVTKYKVGDRVGVGCMVDSCGDCENCRKGEEQYCLKGNVPTYAGVDKYGEPTQGGYSTHIVVTEDFAVRIPDSIGLDAAAPLLCAGITTFSPLNHWGAGPGKKVAVVGMGGLGHMAVQIAHAMGAEVTVLSQTLKKKEDGLQLGADNYYATSDPETFEKLAGTFNLIINTVSAKINMDAYLGLLALDGTLVNVGAPAEPLSLSVFNLIGHRRSFAGSMIGGIRETQEMLEFCAEHNIVPTIEVISADQIDEAYERVLASDVKYRFVIDISTM
jgi:alcohol dehydrogenase (NADP+)